MKKFILPVAALALLAGCAGSGKNENKAAEEVAEEPTEEATCSLEGTWRLTDFAGDGEVQVMDAEQNYTLNFDPAVSIFGMTTDCNAIGGQYKVEGDSLTFNNFATTLMECPNQEIQKAMSTILPMITTYTIVGDSVLILRSDARIMANFTRVE